MVVFCDYRLSLISVFFIIISSIIFMPLDDSQGLLSIAPVCLSINPSVRHIWGKEFV